MKKGFTLIELLVVIAVIGILASIVLASLNNARMKSRDAARKQALVTLRTALELYRNKNGSYPVTANNWYTSDPVNNGYIGTNSGNWIPGLVASGEISQLPKDPIGGTGCGPFQKSFVYVSTDGSGYLLLSHCAVESVASVSSNDPFYAGNWRTTSWMVCSGNDCGLDFPADGTGGRL